MDGWVLILLQERMAGLDEVRGLGGAGGVGQGEREEMSSPAQS